MPDGPTPADALVVMVTGATGFVGFHTARALLAAGHRVRALVRSPEKARRLFEPGELAALDVVPGDITDAGSVEAALEGCDAVLHAAAMVSVHARDADRVLATNRRGAELVLGGAVARGVERIAHVSSTTVLFRRDARRVDERSPLGTATSGYGGSKIACERFVRGLQDGGAPIAITYPGSVIGPDDPGLSEAVAGLKAMAESRIVTVTTSGMQLIDVRDVAWAHRRLLERGGPADRFLMGGHYVTWRELADLLERVTGERFARIPVPAAAMRAFGALVDQLDRVVRLDVPMTAEAAAYATDWAVADDRHLQETLGLEYRPLEESVRDTLDWLGRTGQLRAMFLPW